MVEAGAYEFADTAKFLAAGKTVCLCMCAIAVHLFIQHILEGGPPNFKQETFSFYSLHKLFYC